MKRLTDPDKWSDPWFRRLSLEHKVFWLFICDKCDIAGLWKVDLEMAAFLCGVSTFDGPTLLDVFTGRIKDLGNDRWWVQKFIAFQQGNSLNPKNNCHLGIIRRLEHLAIPLPIPLKPCQGPKEGLTRPSSNSKGNSKGKYLEGESEREPFLARAKSLFHKRETTLLDRGERSAWNSARKIVSDTTDEEWAILEWTYQQTEGDAAKWRRKDLATLLNNWRSQIDRSREWKRNGNGHHLKETPIDRQYREAQERRQREKQATT